MFKENEIWKVVISLSIKKKTTKRNIKEKKLKAERWLILNINQSLGKRGLAEF